MCVCVCVCVHARTYIWFGVKLIVDVNNHIGVTPVQDEYSHREAPLMASREYNM